MRWELPPTIMMTPTASTWSCLYIVMVKKHLKKLTACISEHTYFAPCRKHVATSCCLTVLVELRGVYAFLGSFRNSELSPKIPWLSRKILSLQALFQTSPHSHCYHGPPRPQSNHIVVSRQNDENQALVQKVAVAHWQLFGWFIWVLNQKEGYPKMDGF